MKVYGADICPGCRQFKEIQKQRGFEADYIDIVENVMKLREFLEIRDTDPVFAPVKERHSIGIPLFVREDGAKTFDMNEALSWIGQAPVEDTEMAPTSCGINGCK